VNWSGWGQRQVAGRSDVFFSWGTVWFLTRDWALCGGKQTQPAGKETVWREASWRAFGVLCVQDVMNNSRVCTRKKGNEKRTFFQGVNEITLRHIPWNRITFWKRRTPWWILCSALQSKTFAYQICNFDYCRRKLE